MPYITEESRRPYRGGVDTLADQITGIGDMNYVITRFLYHWYRRNPGYFAICQVMGTLICVAFEFYRRIAAPYEDKKKNENGDVYARSDD